MLIVNTTVACMRELSKPTVFIENQHNFVWQIELFLNILVEQR